VVLRLEKKPTLVDDEWMGVLEEEQTERGMENVTVRYDDRESAFDVDEYIAGMTATGTVNETLVDRDMFTSSGFDKDVLNDLTKGGTLKDLIDDIPDFAGPGPEGSFDPDTPLVPDLAERVAKAAAARAGGTLSDADADADAGRRGRAKRSLGAAQSAAKAANAAARAAKAAVSAMSALSDDGGQELAAADVPGLKVADLKTALRDRGLKVGGVKAELAARLAEALAAGEAAVPMPVEPPKARDAYARGVARAKAAREGQ